MEGAQKQNLMRILMLLKPNMSLEYTQKKKDIINRTMVINLAYSLFESD
jgi:hypothetical protein